MNLHYSPSTHFQLKISNKWLSIYWRRFPQMLTFEDLDIKAVNIEDVDGKDLRC